MKPIIIKEAFAPIPSAPVAASPDLRPMYQAFSPANVKQHCKFAEVAIAALIEQHGSVVLTPRELADKAWDIADEMVNAYQQRRY